MDALHLEDWGDLPESIRQTVVERAVALGIAESGGDALQDILWHREQQNRLKQGDRAGAHAARGAAVSRRASADAAVWSLASFGGAAAAGRSRGSR